MKVGCVPVRVSKYADDLVLAAQNEAELQQLLDQTYVFSKSVHLWNKRSKSYCMVAKGHTQKVYTLELMIDGKRAEQVSDSNILEFQ